jgi:hypothetical protein
MSTLNPKHHIEHERAATAVNLSFLLRAGQASGAPIEYLYLLLPDRSYSAGDWPLICLPTRRSPGLGCRPVTVKTAFDALQSVTLAVADDAAAADRSLPAPKLPT